MLKKAKWTGRLVGKMHNEDIRVEDIASELGISTGYASMILNGKRNPSWAKEKFEQAISDVIEKRKSTTQAGEG